MKSPRDKFRSLADPQKLDTDELIAVILGQGSTNPDVYKLSQEITNMLREKIGSPVSLDDLTSIDGVGEVIAMQIITALELGRRFYSQKTNKKLSEEDWDFAGLKQSERQYGVHFFHHYTAKFIPQIPAKIIRHFTKGNNIVVDPFMGSGTTLVEAKMLGCNSYGLDTNPMAIKIAQAKTLQVDDEKLKEIDEFLQWLELRKKNPIFYSNGESDHHLFEGSEEWFRDDVARKVNSIISVTERFSPDIRNFIEVGLSTLLKGISNARMDSVTPVLPEQPIYTDRKHYYREVNNQTRKIPVYQRLYSQLSRMRAAILEFNKETDDSLICKPILGDARQLIKFVRNCDLVVTSPPYWSAQNYAKIHMLSMKLFNLKIETGEEIGRDSSKYLQDMKGVFDQIANILKGHFALVIGHDDKKNTHDKLFQTAKDSGFHHVDTVTRRISNQVSRAKQIKNEYVYIFRV